MEFAVLLAVALVTAAYIALPQRAVEAPASTLEELWARRAELRLELREFDEDEASGRISAADRVAGRRALAAEVRAVAEALREHGVTLQRPP